MKLNNNSISHSELEALSFEGIRKNFLYISLSAFLAVIASVIFQFADEFWSSILVVVSVLSLLISRYASSRYLLFFQRVAVLAILLMTAYLVHITPSFSVIIVLMPTLVFVYFIERSKFVRLSALISSLIIFYLAFVRFKFSLDIGNFGGELAYFLPLFDCSLAALFIGLFIRSHSSFSRLTIEAARQHADEIQQANQETEAIVKELGERLEILAECEEQATKTLSVERLTKSQLEASKEQLEQFAYAASHDLKEPIRTVRSFLQIVQRKLSNEIIEEEGLKEYFDFVDRNTEAMQNLLARLLTFSRIGSMEIVPTSVSLDKVLAIAAIPYRDNLEINLEGNKEDYVIVVDPGFIKIIVEELLSNAVLFRKSGQLAKLTVEVSKNVDGDTLLKFTDQGIGIEKMYEEKVFGLFQRLNPQELYAGSGLGLSLVRRLVEVIHGKAWLSSELGVGTSIYVVLPKGEYQV